MLKIIKNNNFVDIEVDSLLSKYQVLEILNNNEKYYNIWRNWKLSVENKLDYMYFDIYIVKEKAFWENISYEVYNTINYWWILAIFNDVFNPFESLEIGTKLLILKSEYIPTLLKQIQDIKN